MFSLCEREQAREIAFPQDRARQQAEAKEVA